MRSLVSILFFCFLSTQFFANSTAISKVKRCELLIAESMDAVKDLSRVENDLTNGVWSWTSTNSDRAERKKIFQFHESGLLDVLTVSESNNGKLNTRIWELTSVGDSYLLSIKDLRAKEDNLFILQQTCDGILLSDFNDSEGMNLVYEKEKENDLVLRYNSNLLGQWISKIGSLGLSKTIQMSFKSDGTFDQLTIEGDCRISQNGVWEISPEGTYLILHYVVNGKGDFASERQIIKIHNLDFNAMDLTICSTQAETGGKREFLSFDKLSFPLN